MPISIVSDKQVGVLPDTFATQLFLMDSENFLDSLPPKPIFDLVVTSPPYNIGKEYENQKTLTEYVAWQRRIIEKIYPRLKDDGSICWQVGNYVKNGSITPIDIELAPIFKELNLHLRNRIIWHYGHGLHNKKRFSGRYEVVMWYDKWLDDKTSLTLRDSLRITIDAALRMNPDGFDALMQLLEDADCLIKRGAHISIKPPNGERYIRLDSLGAEYTETALRDTLNGNHVHIPKIPRSEYTPLQVKRLVDIEAKLKEGKGKGYLIWAERNNIDAKAKLIIYLKENHIDSIEALEDQLHALKSIRNKLHAAVREKQNRMKEINQLRRAIRDYHRTKEVYEQYKQSGWSTKFYQEHQHEIDAHKKAQAVYSSVNGKMPTLKELTAEYDNLKSEITSDKAALENLKPQITTLHHIKYNIDILERDYLPDTRDIRRHSRPER